MLQLRIRHTRITTTLSKHCRNLPNRCYKKVKKNSLFNVNLDFNAFDILFYFFIFIPIFILLTRRKATEALYNSHIIYRAKFCAMAFLCPTVGNLDTRSCSLCTYSDMAVPLSRQATKL